MERLIKLITKIALEVLKNLEEREVSPPPFFPGRLVTEKDVIIYGGKNQKVLYISPKTLVTPLALDKAREIGLLIERKACLEKEG